MPKGRTRTRSLPGQGDLSLSTRSSDSSSDALTSVPASTIRSTTLSIGGISIQLNGPAGRLAALEAPRYSQFISSSADPDIRLNLAPKPREAQEALASLGAPRFDSGTVWSLYSDRSSTSILLRSPAHGNAPYRLAVFDSELRNGEITTLTGPATQLAPEEQDPLEFPLSEILTVCMLADRRGVMVHACGLDCDGRGLLFPGNSTDGKSTMARLWSHRGRILNDDRIILRPTEGGFAMYGTPWHGDVSNVSADGTRLKNIHFLFHGRKNLLTPVMGAEAAAMLLQRSFLPLWDSSGMSWTLELCSRICESVPCHRLEFVPDCRVVDLLRCEA